MKLFFHQNVYLVKTSLKPSPWVFVSLCTRWASEALDRLISTRYQMFREFFPSAAAKDSLLVRFFHVPWTLMVSSASQIFFSIRPDKPQKKKKKTLVEVRRGKRKQVCFYGEYCRLADVNRRQRDVNPHAVSKLLTFCRTPVFRFLLAFPAEGIGVENKPTAKATFREKKTKKRKKWYSRSVLDV